MQWCNDKVKLILSSYSLLKNDSSLIIHPSVIPNLCDFVFCDIHFEECCFLSIMGVNGVQNFQNVFLYFPQNKVTFSFKNTMFPQNNLTYWQVSHQTTSQPSLPRYFWEMLLTLKLATEFRLCKNQPTLSVILVGNTQTPFSCCFSHN